uniref:Uncharacterized protein n=1 Tax=Anguilla anguilla TaxID=7936 RepID=A0A0E9TX97_ANGAN
MSRKRSSWKDTQWRIISAPTPPLLPSQIPE